MLSNCLAGWLLSGGGSLPRFLLLWFGATCLYLGGMFLNDAFDADFDRQRRPERPIPAGAITPAKVWGWGFGWMMAGVLMLSLLGPRTLVLAVLLAICIVAYDAIHKAVTLSPLLMALCRWFLYLVAGSAPGRRMNGLAVWSGLALAIYVLGLSLMARKETARERAAFWSGWLLAGPIVLAWVVNAGEYRFRATLVSGVLALWIVRCLQDTFWSPAINVGRTVGGLLAGICLVDLLAIGGGTIPEACAFTLMFFAALLCQRIVPAT